jgi:hypothetical protein
MNRAYSIDLCEGDRVGLVGAADCVDARDELGQRGALVAAVSPDRLTKPGQAEADVAACRLAAKTDLPLRALLAAPLDRGVKASYGVWLL